MGLKYKLTYFDARGIAEPIRFILSYIGEPFEDHRIKRANWLKLKATTPFGKLPILEIDGVKYTQSLPLYRYLGKQAQLAGDSDIENLNIDIIADVLLDLRLAGAAIFWEPDEEEKKNKENIFINETLAFNLRKLEEVAKHNNGYLANGKLSWADLMFASIMENINYYLPKKDYLESCPTLKALKEKVLTLPNIKTWTGKRLYTIL